MATVADTLRAAKALIDTPEKWCVGTPKRNSGRLCAGWALDRIVTLATPLDAPVFVTFRRAAGIPHEVGIGDWQDERTHAEVMEAFDRAIALAEQEGA